MKKQKKWDQWIKPITQVLGLDFLSESCLEEKKEYKIEDKPWMFRQVIWFCEQWYYKINFKYVRCKHTKTKSCYKNISCWFICSSIFSFFLLCGDLKFDLMFFIQLIWWIRTRQNFKNFIKQNCSNFCCIPYQIYLIQQIWSS